MIEVQIMCDTVSTIPTESPKANEPRLSIPRGLTLDLFLASFLALFLELVLIRWVPSYERVLAYFTNFVLIAAFLGLGVGGMLGRRRRPWLRFQPLLVLGVVITAILFNQHIKTFGIAGDTFYTNVSREAKIGLLLPECLAFFFLLIAVVFVPLGQKIGQDLASYPVPIRGYVINILGSLAGVLIFTVVSFLGLSPFWWFLGIFVGLLWFVRDDRKWIKISLASAIVTLMIVWQVGANFVWTPYNKLAVRSLVETSDGNFTDTKDPIHPRDVSKLRSTLGFSLAINDDFYQQATDLRPAAVQAHPVLTNDVLHYEFGYNIPGLAYDYVLVVGAGTGNEVAEALRRAAKPRCRHRPPRVAPLPRSHPRRPAPPCRCRERGRRE